MFLYKWMLNGCIYCNQETNQVDVKSISCVLLHVSFLPLLFSILEFASVASGSKIQLAASMCCVYTTVDI